MLRRAAVGIGTVCFREAAEVGGHDAGHVVWFELEEGLAAEDVRDVANKENWATKISPGMLGKIEKKVDTLVGARRPAGRVVGAWRPAGRDPPVSPGNSRAACSSTLAPHPRMSRLKSTSPPSKAATVWEPKHTATTLPGLSVNYLDEVSNLRRVRYLPLCDATSAQPMCSMKILFEEECVSCFEAIEVDSSGVGSGSWACCHRRHHGNPGRHAS